MSNILDWLGAPFRRGSGDAAGSSISQAPPAVKPRRAIPLPVSVRGLAAGRLSTDSGYRRFGFLTILEPDNDDDGWRTGGYDEATLDRISVQDLVKLLTNLSPEVSNGIWHFLRFCNPGYTIRVLRDGSDDEDPRAMAIVDAFLDKLRALYSSLDIPINRLFLGAYLRGGMLAELVMEDNGRDAADLATPDPAIVRFRSATDPVRGQIWQAGQRKGGQWVPYDRETIVYLPIDPLPGSPYGRPMVAPAIFSALFLLGLLHDLRRVVQQQGWPRIDVSVDLQAIADAMREDAENPEQMAAVVDKHIQAVQEAYSKLQPDDAFVHTSSVIVNRPVGTLDTNSLGAVDKIVDSVVRMLIRALKTMPLLMGVTDGVSEANANRQWEIHVAGIKAIQHLQESLWERMLGLVLQAQGMTARVEFRFAEIRASEELRDAQTEQMKIDNAFKKWAYGWIPQEAAAEEVVGHVPDAPEPRYLPNSFTSSSAPDAATANPDAGAMRAASRRREPFTPKPGPPPGMVAGAKAVTDDDIAEAVSAWDSMVTEEYRGMLDAPVVNAGE